MRHAHPLAMKTALPTITLAALVTFFPAAPLVAQTDPGAALEVPLEERLPTTPALTVGTLDNGLRYFIRENAEPANRAFLRLVVNAGSVLEDDGQRGAAHFLEHMAFNGTERFEKQELVAFMESIGMRLGPSVNASTSFDETVYMLTVPTDVPEHMETALDILEDWAQGLTLDPDEIEQERGVVLEEWRSGQGAASRIRDQQFPILFRDSRYAERLPIGTPESIQAMDRETLQRFYGDWYRPELMAVVAVGDFDAERVEASIRRRFERLPASSPQAPERLELEVPTHEETLFAVVSDPEQPAATVQVIHKISPDDDSTVGAFRRRLVEQLYNGLLNLRFQEITREPDAPFVAASSQTARPIRASGMYLLLAAVPEDGIERGLSALLQESARLARFGFTESELERGKINALRAMEQRYANRGSRPSPALAGQYVQAFLTDRAVPGMEYEKALYERFVPEITLEEVNAVGRGWLEDSSRVVLVTAPERAGFDLPDEAELAAVLREAGDAELEHYADTLDDGVLLDEPPTGSRIVAARARAGGVTEWALDNGVRVVLKPTDFSEDQVVFRAFLPGGSSLAADEDFVAAQTAAAVIMSSGLGERDATALQRALTGRVAGVNVVVADDAVRLEGQASVQDLQTMFELIYLRFTAPRADQNAFAALQGQMRLVLGNRDNNPLVALNDAFNRVMTQDHLRARPLTADLLDQMSLERSLAFYRDRFADASGSTFLFVGAFDLDTMRPLVESYLGALPAAGRAETWRDHGIRLPEGVIEEAVHKGFEPRSQTRLSFHGEFDMKNPSERALLGAMGNLLETHLRTVLREELGGTYNVSVQTRMRWTPVETYALVIEFGSDPERSDELVERVFAEIADLKRSGPSSQRVADTLEGILRTQENNERQNGWWLVALGASYEYEADPDPADLLAFPELVEALTPEAIQEGMERYLDTENYVRVTLMPEV